MLLHEQLLNQALALLAWDESEAGARRAVSAAYYALFHLLVTEAVERMIPAHPAGLRIQARRMFTHANMRDVCQQFAKSNLHPSTKALVSFPIEMELRLIAEDFALLQEARHKADYDLGLAANQIWAAEKVGHSEAAFGRWSAVREAHNATVFLVALGLQRQWNVR